MFEQGKKKKNKERGKIIITEITGFEFTPDNGTDIVDPA